MTLWQESQGVVRIRVELNENQIPNLDATRVFLVHQLTACVAVRCEIDMHFRARPARTGVAHHPEIVCFSTVENVDGRIEIGFAKQSRPMIVRFLVELARFAGAGFVDSRVKALRREFPAIDHEFPCPLDGFSFKVIAEAPITQHFEKRVVISIQPDVFEIVMFTAGANAFLCIGNPRRIPRRLLLAEEDRDELIHPGVREKQIRRVRQQG